jgi:AcrR family transcriptional regulator
MLSILVNGLSGPAATWAPQPRAAPPPETGREDISLETFLKAATQIINDEGYRGASVDKISARLNVTKGSFYHHIDAKDDLVTACLRRTVEVMGKAQRAARQVASDGWTQLSAAAVSLVERQLAGDTPLLRTSALTSAPESIQAEILAEFDRISLSFASMISDGIEDGSVRAVDANIGAQMITAMINAAAELTYWAPRLSAAEASDTYVRALFEGIDTVLRVD